MNDRIADTRQCPYCRQWIPMPLRRQREAFEAHKHACHEKTYPAWYAHADTRQYFEAHKLNCPEVQYKGSPGDHRNPEEPRADDCETCGMEHLPPMESPFHEVTDPDERAFMDGVAERLEAAMTIKRADLWGNITDTHQTEAELNGFRASQGALL